LIRNELDKILITKDFIDLEDLNLVSKEFDDNIFDIVNDLLSAQTKNAIFKLRDLSFSLDNPFLLYNSLIANLRIYFYIFILKDS
jgi:DNA polymerase III delta subunit